MSMAVDFGAHRLKSLRRRESTLAARACRARYAATPDLPERRKLLDQLGIPHAICEEHLVLIGDAAAEYARLFQTPCVSLLPGGRVPQDDPPARQILGSIVEALLPPPAVPRETCCLTVPGQDGPHRHGRETEFLTRLVRLQGYTPVVLGAGMAVVLAELVSNSFSGIGISFGEATCQLSLAHRGNELASCTVPRAGRWIDEELARAAQEYAWDARGNRYLDAEAAAVWKQSVTSSLTSPAEGRETLRAELYERMIEHLLETAAREFAAVPETREVPQPVPIVAAGGTARAAGFEDMLQRCLAKSSLPLRVGRCRVVAESDYVIARGLLIHAELEAEFRGKSRRAA